MRAIGNTKYQKLLFLGKTEITHLVCFQHIFFVAESSACCQ